METEDLNHIFYSGYSASPEWELLDELSFLIKNGVLCCRQKNIYSKKVYYDLVDQVKSTEGLGPQEKGHMALKKIAQSFLAELGLKSDAERSFLGTHPDVLSRDFSWVVECGTTDPGSVIFFLRDSRVKDVGLLPYPYEGESQLTLYVFSRGKNFDQYVAAKTGRLKAVFNKFHRKSF